MKSSNMISIPGGSKFEYKGRFNIYSFLVQREKFKEKGVIKILSQKFLFLLWWDWGLNSGL
jgi:hypothetical protein